MLLFSFFVFLQETYTMNLSLDGRLAAFEQLGIAIKERKHNQYTSLFEETTIKQSQHNPWFIPSFIDNALDAIAEMLSQDSLKKIKKQYENILPLTTKEEKIAVVSAGNIPLVGFHDFFSVLISGNNYIGKLSSVDNLLLPLLAKILLEIEPAFSSKISFEEKLTTFDKVIATGSNNSARYFEYYFRNYPYILRQNRNSIAVLSGEETDDQLRGLYNDIFLYFGLGCRSVSKLFVPENYSFNRLIDIFTEMGNEIAMHHHYLNNLDFQKTIHLMNRHAFIDAGIALLIESTNLSSPIGIIHYEFYNSIESVNRFVENEKDKLQCVVSDNPIIKQAVPFGESQSPDILDFADNVDTILFCSNNKKSSVKDS